MACTQPLLSLSNISIAFAGVQALKTVDFAVMPGEIHCLAGENGCGKSTLIKIITGVYLPTRGAHISFDGQTIATMTPALAQRLGIRVIWQDLALFPEMTVAENIAFQTLTGAGSHWVSYKKMEDIARQALEYLGVNLDIQRPLKDYGIAQRQLVAIARALVGQAKLVFMDEPTASLTQAETNELLKIVRHLAANGVAVVFVSHRLHEILAICSRLTVLRDGSLVGVYPVAEMTAVKITQLMTGRSFTPQQRKRDIHQQPVRLSVQALSRPGEFEAISFELRRGEILGITGRLGAGRTELALTLFGMKQPLSGSILLEGKPLNFAHNRQAIAAGIAYLSEDRLALGLNQPQSIADNLIMASLSQMLNLFRLLSIQKQRQTVTHWIEKLDIKIGRSDDAIATLSGGNQQRIAIAKWLATHPKILILDCPTVGVDVGARADLFNIIAQLAQTGLAIILISDEVPEVWFNADRILHMENGRIKGQYDPQHIDLKSLEAQVYG